ncbi:MAG: STAS domain-containing protein [Acidimicrobiales bacterium]
MQAVILEANGMSDIDFTGLKALRDLAGEFSQRGVTIEIARASHLAHHDLKHGALLQQFGPDHLFASVEQAVSANQRRP